MKKICLLAILPILSSCSSGIRTVKSKDFDPSQPLRVAVMELEGPDQEAAQAIADSIVPDLMEMGFSVIERNQLAKIMQEQNLQFTGILDTNTAKEIGRIAGVDAILVGDFTIKENETVEHRSVGPNNPPPPGPNHRPGPGPGPNRPHHPEHRPQPPQHHPQPGHSETIIHKEINFTSLSLRLVSVQTGQILISSSRRKPFDTHKLNDIVDNMVDSMKSTLKK